jgi:hypothetical protein
LRGVFDVKETIIGVCSSISITATMALLVNHDARNDIRKSNRIRKQENGFYSVYGIDIYYHDPRGEAARCQNKTIEVC